MRLTAVLFLAILTTWQLPEQDSRQIWDDGYLSKRPNPQAPAQTPSKGARDYRPPETGDSSKSELDLRKSRPVLGFTIWRLRRPDAVDGNAPRIIVQDKPGEGAIEYLPERIRPDTILHVGDRLRMAIESPKEGFLYVLNRERYRDGTYGEPYVLFPTLNLNKGDNRVAPGRLIEIPAQSDPVPALRVARHDDRHIGEELLILVSPSPLPDVPIGFRETKMPANVWSARERQWAAVQTRLDLVASEGAVWTTPEKAAGATQRLLTQEDPMPSSIYVSTSPSDTQVFVRIPLEVR